MIRQSLPAPGRAKFHKVMQCKLHECIGWYTYTNFSKLSSSGHVVYVHEVGFSNYHVIKSL